MIGFKTIRQAGATEHLNKSSAWIRAAIRSGKLKATLIDNRLYIISDEEIERIKKNPITISRQEMFGGMGESK